MTGELRLAPRRGITEDDLAQAQPLIRAVIHERLEDLWAFCAPHLHGEVDRPDPRMAELALRALKELKDLYRLDRAQPAAPADDGRTPAEIAIAKIREDMLALAGKRD